MRREEAFLELGQVGDDPIRLVGWGEGLQFVLGGDTGQREDGLHSDAFATGDIGFEVIADEDAPGGLDAEFVAQFEEEFLFGLSAEDGVSVGRVSEQLAERSAAEFKSAWAGEDAIGTDADQFGALSEQDECGALALFGRIHIRGAAGDDGVARGGWQIHPIDFSVEEFLYSGGCEVEDAWAAVFFDDVGCSGFSCREDVFGGDVHAHAF